MTLKPGDLPVLAALIVPTGDREVFVNMEIACRCPAQPDGTMIGKR
ncbi:hypothetical protein LQV63_02400 [Paenibacillus profundus]|uniref:Uncharacterized protein n=1 Tax=Paenibacillus profundus TaxID=1173085 RepID=A0ABS8YDM7_9BACL|nr:MULTISPECIES: hypothetical protein [Paenibacillus]MCE5168172.1 hypothetical protein [Paenibacillus profundus]MCM3337421.1 hypothetical protein [Paenibacillus sp. MER TA 81-3]